MKKWIWILLSAMLLPALSCTTSGKKQDKHEESEETIQAEQTEEEPRQQQKRFKPMSDEESRHLLFKGVPIDGSLRQYVSRMESVGFTLEGVHDNGMAVLSGDFAGWKNCLIFVSTLDSRDIVNHISVRFPSCDKWADLELVYTQLKSMLTEKYGKPARSVEKFHDYYSYPNKDSEKLHCLQFDECTYYAQFELEKGEILLSLEHEEYDAAFVALQYWDKINTKLVKQDAINDL